MVKVIFRESAVVFISHTVFTIAATDTMSQIAHL